MSVVIRVRDNKFYSLYGPIADKNRALSFTTDALAREYATANKVPLVAVERVADAARDPNGLSDATKALFGYGARAS